MRDLFEQDVIRRLTRAGCEFVQQFQERRWRLPDGTVVCEAEALRWMDHQHEHGGEGGHE